MSFALADFMSREEAKRFVRESAEIALKTNQHLIDVIQDKVDAPIDWEQLRDEQSYLGSVEELIGRILDACQHIN